MIIECKGYMVNNQRKDMEMKPWIVPVDFCFDARNIVSVMETIEDDSNDNYINENECLVTFKNGEATTINRPYSEIKDIFIKLNT